MVAQVLYKQSFRDSTAEVTTDNQSIIPDLNNVKYASGGEQYVKIPDPYGSNSKRQIA
jgi:hypothetical protein